MWWRVFFFFFDLCETVQEKCRAPITAGLLCVIRRSSWPTKIFFFPFLFRLSFEVIFSWPYLDEGAGDRNSTRSVFAAPRAICEQMWPASPFYTLAKHDKKRTGKEKSKILYLVRSNDNGIGKSCATGMFFSTRRVRPELAFLFFFLLGLSLRRACKPLFPHHASAVWNIQAGGCGRVVAAAFFQTWHN